MADEEEVVAVIEGPKGKAEIYEIWAGGRITEHQVRFEGKSESFTSLGEAYISAGQKTGKPT